VVYDVQTVSCLVRVEGRVVLKAVKEMKPTITVVASLLHDVEPETPSRWLYLDKLVSKVVNESSAVSRFSFFALSSQ
jgi:hypothetical protein